MRGDVRTSFIVLIIVIALTVLGYIFIFLYISPKPVQLSSVEINEYQGEKLGSINDFRENSIKGVQYIDEDEYRLDVHGLVAHPKNYTYNEVLDFPSYEKVVTLNCVEGWSVKVLWEGILMEDLINEAKPDENAKVVIFRAADGYSDVFPIDYLVDNNIILAYKMNNVTIPPERGFPFQIVAESKWGYKWVKWITEIEFSDDENYLGYWENYGYSKNGDLNRSFIE